LLCGFLTAAAAQTAEVRALWVQRTSLTSSTRALSVVQTAKDSGFNTLIVQVRGRGDAYYTSRYEPRAAALAKEPASFDPLALLLASAHRNGLKVHAWVNVNLVSDAVAPASREHVVRAHPDWLMVPRTLAHDLNGMNPRRPEYLRRLAEYVREHNDQVEGMFVSPIQRGAVDHTVKVIGDIASRYDLDGVHLDYIRYPGDDFDYGRDALEEFETELVRRISATERREYARRARGRPFFYTEMFPQRWQEFRRARLTMLLERIRSIVKSRRPNAMLTAAVFPDAADAANHRFQDWGAWLDRGLLDAVCPMAYTVDPALFRAQIASAEQRARLKPVWAGIGAFRLPPAATVENIRAARELGAEGFVLFSYDNLDTRYVTTVSKGAFAK
jgi:uncharacterized lipoprotein YddW (UPF0748 family)